MKTYSKFLVVSFFIFSIFVLPCSIVFAEIPHLINYQGRLTDANNVPLNGSYNITFRIYDAETAGNLLWEENQTGVIINKGIFSILLGSVTNLNLSFDKPYYLEIKVGNEVMSPRQRITAAGYAISAENAEKIKASNTDTTPGTLEAKTKNSIVVDGNQLQLSGDVASPGNDKVYGTDSNGVRGWYDRSNQDMQVFTSSGTWVRPAGVNRVYVKVWGAGGGGGSRKGSYGCGGGGAGGYSEGFLNVTDNIPVTIGSGGAAGNSNSGSDGNPGGMSSFGSITANGGTGGASSGSSGGSGGFGGAASGGSWNLTGNNGTAGSSNQTSGEGGNPQVVPLQYGTQYGKGGSGAPGFGDGWGQTGKGGLVIVYW